MSQRRKAGAQLRHELSRRMAEQPVLLNVCVRLTGRELRAWRFRHGPACVPSRAELADYVQTLVSADLARIPGAVALGGGR